jgi:carbon-monoxide dehydrogenase medium subunit
MPVALRSHAHIQPFRLHRPTGVAEAAAMQRAMPGAAFMAGGLELIGRMKWGEVVPDVIHLARVAGLADITTTAGGLRIGAGATHAAIAGNAVVAALLPDLAALWPLVANPRVRFSGTIGGNLCSGQSGYDGVPAMLALGASFEMAGGQGLMSTPGSGLLTALHLPAGTMLLTDRSLKPAIIAWLGLDLTQGRVRAARLAFGAAHAAAVMLELPLAGTPIAALADAAPATGAWVATALPEPLGDGLTSAAYRRRMAGVLARRLLIRAGARA